MSTNQKQNTIDEDFSVVIASEPDDSTVVLTSDQMGKQWLDRAMSAYDPTNRMYSAFLNDSGSAATLTQGLIESLGEGAQSNLTNIQTINNIIRKYINIDDLIGMVVQSICNNINTEYRLSYRNFGEQRNKAKTLQKAKALIEDFNNQINIKQLIRDSIQTSYIEGNYICLLRNNDTNWTVDYLPLGVAEITGYSESGNPVVLINISNLRSALSKTMIKNKNGKVLFFKDTDEEVKNSYDGTVYKAFKDKESYARLDTAYTGVVRVNNLSRKYGLSPIFRALSPTLMLSTYRNTDESSAKSKAKKIIHQVMREKCLGDAGKDMAFEAMAFSHDQLMKAWKNNTVVITTNPAVEKIVYVEPKTDDVSVDKVNVYRNKVLSSLGVAFLANDKSQTASTANINLSQLMKCINGISEQVERMLENFYRTVLTINNIGLEYCPSIKIVDSELLEFDMKMDLAKMLYATFNGSMESSLSLIGIDLEDEKAKREQENADGLESIFTPRITAYTSGGYPGDNTPVDNKGGRSKDKNSNNPDKQLEDEEYNKTRE